MKTLILGGVRSGKSHYAEKLSIQRVKESQGKLVYIATSFPYDDEMKQRVDEHQEQRRLSGQKWITVEETLYLANSLKLHASANTTILIDCLTLWMTNLLCHENTGLLNQETEKLLSSIPKLKGNILFVSNETGLGIVPIDKLTRQFVEKMGRFHQDLAVVCDQVDFVIAGLTINIKSKK